MEQKSILIVTDRSSYFSFLGKDLEKFYNVYYIAVWKKDEILLKEKGIPYIPRDDLLRSSTPAPANGILNNEEIKEALSCDLKYDVLYNNGNLQDSIFIEGLNYADKINKLIQTNKIDLVIVQNDSWNYASIPIAVARKNNIKTLIFEDGFFRPDTIVLDRKGVNKNNSCPREKTYYENITINKGKYDTFIQKENIKGSGPIADLFSGVKLSNVAGKLFNFFRHPRKIFRVIPLTINLIGFLHAKSGFILLPLQVRSDSQIICHSPLKDMEDFVDICLTSIENYNRKYNKHFSVVIKEHPKDPQMDLLRRTRKKHKNVKNYYLTKANTRKLIEKCIAIITINSTIGIESLLYYKPVITLGQAFYNIDGLVHYCADPAKLDNVINTAISTPTGRKLTDNFLYYLKFDYQIDGDLNNPDADNIKPVIKRIRDILDHEI
jgi:capsular polysaccharide export protein